MANKSVKKSVKSIEQKFDKTKSIEFSKKSKRSESFKNQALPEDQLLVELLAQVKNEEGYQDVIKIVNENRAVAEK